mmetsp:Transcript_24709/g.58638  ORF Transcript_24709/g.58638 Transcript_24709/m.58638 type:complete len:368 (+) Transcript_24709:256-1359(+)
MVDQLCDRIQYSGRHVSIRCLWGVISCSPLTLITQPSTSTAVVASSAEEVTGSSSTYKILNPSLLTRWMKAMVERHDIIISHHNHNHQPTSASSLSMSAAAAVRMDQGLRHMVESEFLLAYRDVQYYCLTSICSLATEAYNNYNNQQGKKNKDGKDNGDDDDDNHHNHDDDEGEQDDNYHTGDNPEQMTTKMSIGYGNIICRQDICQAGEILEVVPVLVLPKRRVIGTLLESVMIEWDWIVTATIPVTVQVMICCSTEASDGANNSNSKAAITRSDLVEMNVHDTLLLPLAGCISMIARDVDTTKYNAVLELEDDPYNSTGYMIRVISTRSIAAGESVIVNIPKDPENASSIVEEIVLTGQKLISST